ncbi:resistance to inhibitors of cholinesterase protein 3-like isoform X2 [Littorina saxatilis]|uniref:Resistance to inhibitors of cholinesterase protein 3 N-terminal domain-containing protein n=1 Tax=Littorina saxatilis TaxID=31220 RepID=A0AAN9B5V8_9CAEN
MASLKTLGTIAIIVGCFAIIYPRFLHPMVLRMFGMQVKSQKGEDSSGYPPHMRNGAPVPGDRRPPPMPNDPKDVRQHMRPGPHPGMRAAAEMQKQQPQGTGRGMMGIVLPMYAIGICVYLVYTLVKVFNKKGKCSDPYTKPRYEGEGEGRMDSLGFPQGMRGGQAGEPGEVSTFLQRKQQQRDLEDLLVKMDDARNVPEDEMRALQRRLEETEAQMTRILQAMQTMQAKAGEVADDTGDVGASDSASTEKVETVGASDADKKEPSAKTMQEGERSAQSSPDTERSYEMVKNNAPDTKDASPHSNSSSPSSFEHVEQNHLAEDQPQVSNGKEEKEGEREEVLMDGKKEEVEDGENSSVRHRKTGHAEED